jgi:hypothetical protein
METSRKLKRLKDKNDKKENGMFTALSHVTLSPTGGVARRYDAKKVTLSPVALLGLAVQRLEVDHAAQLLGSHPVSCTFLVELSRHGGGTLESLLNGPDISGEAVNAAARMMRRLCRGDPERLSRMGEAEPLMQAARAVLLAPVQLARHYGFPTYEGGQIALFVPAGIRYLLEQRDIPIVKDHQLKMLHGDAPQGVTGRVTSS